MYQELVHLLDLCILSYQLHNQTLIWPMDPYYEQMQSTTTKKLRRTNFMAKVHDLWLLNGGALFSQGTHGPNGSHLFRDASNKRLDPIISDYSQINPGRPSVVRPNREEEGWTLYNTPTEITNRIVDVHMVRYSNAVDYDLANPFAATVLQPAAVDGYANGAPAGADWLYCFEGGTGQILKSNTAPAWSMMGFVLAKFDETIPNTYDIYIVFRGSRSGDPRLLTALRTEFGNPDWVTDMDFGLARGKEAAKGRKLKYISETGNVAPGFGASVQTMLPTIMMCLDAIQTRSLALPNAIRAPRAIYVTGHSLGAALAVHFTSAVLMGSPYRYNLTGENPQPLMPRPIIHWPWKATQLVPFALPVVGGEDFHDAFNITLASRRVHIPGDPVTQTVTRYPIGNSYMITPRGSDGKTLMRYAVSGIVNVKAFADHHEPYNIRKYLIRDLVARGLLDRNDQPANDPARPNVYDQKPWEIFFSFNALIRSLGIGNVTAILGDPDKFRDRLGQYLEVLQAVLGGQQRQSVQTLRDAIAGDNDCTATFRGCRNVYQNDTAFHQFLGLCIFLNHVRAMTYAQAKTASLNEPFLSLPLR